MKEKKKLAVEELEARSHGGYIEFDGDAPVIRASDVFSGEAVVKLDGEFCGTELLALVDLMILSGHSKKAHRPGCQFELI